MPDAAGVNIGNYKGVMLCNRPFAGVAAAAKTSSKATPSFLTGTPAEKIGANVPIMKDNGKPAPNRSKKHTALSRHKKWLNDLQKTKDLLEHEMIAEEEAKEEKKQKFMERERKMRAAVRGVDPDDKQSVSSYAGSKNGDDYDYEREMDNDKAAPKNNKKPMWAMTEDKAAKAVEEQEEEEAEELLDFAAGLDFDKFIDDMEVRAMMEQVKGRVDELESAIADEEDVAERLAARAEERENELTEDNMARFEENYDEDEQQKDDDLLSMAESMLSNRDLNQKYSKQAMVEKIKQVQAGAMPSISEAKEDSIIEKNKRQVKASSDANRRQKDAEAKQEAAERLRAAEAQAAQQHDDIDASNLPYLHRNPGV